MSTSPEPGTWLAGEASGLIEPSATLRELRAFTPARVALGRAGVSLPTREVMAFGVAHAQARDAVHAALDLPLLRGALEGEGWTVHEAVSRAGSRAEYLARPDRGRRLDEASRRRLPVVEGGCDLALVLADGLSAVAVQKHAPALLRELRPRLDALRVAPLVIASQARVALADEVGEVLGARVVVSLIGERPGLSSPDSLGAYLTAAPRVGRNDAERNCVSNIHGAGLGYAEAAAQIGALLRAMLQAGVSGVALARQLGLPGAAG